MNLKKIDRDKILSILEDKYSGTETALIFNSSFQLLIATMLAAQSTDVQVNIATKKLFSDFPDCHSLSQISISELEKYIQSVGLYHTKAKNIIATSRILASTYSGQVPDTLEALQTLPGVGRKTANVVLSIAMKLPAIAVDTHVFRVSNRLGLAHSDNVLETEKQLMRYIPKENWSSAHHWLIWHGRKVCKARNPLCSVCPLANLCLFNKGKPQISIRPTSQ